MICGGAFDISKKESDITLIKEKLSDSNIWNNPASAEELSRNLSELNDIVNSIKEIKNNVNLLNEYILYNSESNDEEFNNLYKETVNLINEQEILTYLSDTYDNNDSIFEIHAGAGGTESCDWAEMLNRMYLKYFEKKGYSYEKIDEQPGEEVGIKSISYIVKGKFCYGYLKNEKGVHRLVRLSPFDSNHKRHTSFAAVDVIPKFDNNIDIVLNDNDLRIDVYRSSGAGGQGVNTTDSAVRVTHIPTGIVVTCQNERSQIKNKETALNVLKSKLYQLKIKENKEKVSDLKKDNSNIEFGSQIRSYVLHPYSMIKDHRTNYSTSNVNKVLDGNIDDFIENNLKGVRL